MITFFRLATYWIFQLFNTVTGMGFLFFPKGFSESLMDKPLEAYKLLGLSDAALPMLHAVLRWQGAALTAISLFLLTQGPQSKRGFFLIALVCGLSLLAHVFTLQQYLESDIIKNAISNFNLLYGMAGGNAALALSGAWLCVTMKASSGLTRP